MIRGIQSLTYLMAKGMPQIIFDNLKSAVLVTSHARVHFDGNRYSVPPEIVGKTALEFLD